MNTTPLGCSATGAQAPHRRAQLVGAGRSACRAASLSSPGCSRHRIGTSMPPPDDDDQHCSEHRATRRSCCPRSGGRRNQMIAPPPTTAIICAAGPVRVCQSSSSARGDARHAPRRCTRRSSSRSPRLPPDQQAPADRAGDRQGDDQRRDAPAVAIDRPRFLDVAQPQPLDFGRHALEPLEAMRPGRARGRRRRSSPRPTASASRRFQSAGDSQARPNISALPSNASDSHTGDSASHTASQLSFEAKTRKASAVAAAQCHRISAQPLASPRSSSTQNRTIATPASAR